jgi:hypothetical protein
MTSISPLIYLLAVIGRERAWLPAALDAYRTMMKLLHK